MVFEKYKKHLSEKKYTWLVTGGAGFIGSNLVEFLLIHNQKVIVVDNLSTGYESNLDQALESAAEISKKKLSVIKKNFTFFNDDICNFNICLKATRNVDFVLHQAALGSVPRSIKDPINTNNSNVSGFLNILHASQVNNVSRFVYASSSSVYGDLKMSPKKEMYVGKLLSPYAVTKSINEMYASIFSDIYSIKTIGLRYFNVFGKRQDPNGAYAAVIPKWISSMIKGEKIYINGDGKTSRDFCYIENVIQANILASFTSNDRALNKVFNVALCESTSLNSLFTEIKNYIFENDSNKKNSIKPCYRDFREGDIKFSKADISKATKLIGYKPLVNFNKGIKLTIDWYLSHK